MSQYPSASDNVTQIKLKVCANSYYTSSIAYNIHDMSPDSMKHSTQGECSDVYAICH